MLSPSTSLPDMRSRLSRAVQKLCVATGGGDGGRVDPWMILQHANVSVSYRDRNENLNLCEQQTSDELVLDTAVQADPVEHSSALRHALAHLAVIRSGVAQTVSAELDNDFAASTIELIASQVDRMIAIPAASLLEWKMANPTGINFDGALHFGVELDFFTSRVSEAIRSVWTGDVRCDRKIMRELLGKCISRVDVIRENRLDEFLDRDPMILRDHLTNPQAFDRLSLIDTYGRFGNAQAARDILHLLRQIPRRTFAACVERQPLSRTKRILDIFATLPDGEAQVARSVFFSKLCLLDLGEGELRNISAIDDKVMAAEAHVALGRIFRLRRDHRRSLEEYHRARELDPENPETLAGELNALISMGRLKQAETLLEGADLDEDLRLWYFMGKVAEKQKKLGYALSAYTSVTKYEHPFRRKALARRALIYTTLGRADEAIELYLLLNRLHPYDSDTLAGLAPLLISEGRHAEAVRLLLDVTSIVPLQAWAFRTLGDVYANAGIQQLADSLWAQAELLETNGGSHPKAA